MLWKSKKKSWEDIIFFASPFFPSPNAFRKCRCVPCRPFSAAGVQGSLQIELFAILELTQIHKFYVAEKQRSRDFQISNIVSFPVGFSLAHTRTLVARRKHEKQAKKTERRGILSTTFFFSPSDMQWHSYMLSWRGCNQALRLGNVIITEFLISPFLEAFSLNRIFGVN